MNLPHPRFAKLKVVAAHVSADSCEPHTQTPFRQQVDWQHWDSSNAGPAGEIVRGNAVYVHKLLFVVVVVVVFHVCICCCVDRIN